MKLIIASFLTTLCLTACATIHVNPLPAGAKACGSDYDCLDGQYCGFPHTDGWNYAQCVPGHNSQFDYEKNPGE